MTEALSDNRLKAIGRRPMNGDREPFEAVMELARRWIVTLDGTWRNSRYFIKQGRHVNGYYEFRWRNYAREGEAKFHDRQEAIEFLACSHLLTLFFSRVERRGGTL